MDHGIVLPENMTHVTATSTVGTTGYKDRYKVKGNIVRVSEDLFSLGIGLCCLENRNLDLLDFTSFINGNKLLV